ncbi:MAG: M20/M25/M40 family metallo-hydrolase [Acidobacteria bacterium]|nr:M20/M25/M40 family metallo-hydrolase [Acidobacteriota bacterium]
MKTKGTLSLVILFCLGGAAIAGLPEQADPKRLETWVADLSAPSMGGRLTGSPSGKAAEAYVEDAMRATGLEVRTQEVRFPLWEVLPGASLTLLGQGDAKPHAYAYLDEYREVDYSGSGDVTGDLVFAGFGLQTATVDSYAGVDVKGKVAVILSGKPEGVEAEDARVDRKLDTASRKGAAAVVFIPQGKMGERVEEKGDEAEVQATDLKRDFHPELYHADLPAVFLRRKAAETLLGMAPEAAARAPAARALGKRVHLVLQSRLCREAVSRNVFGILRGSDPALAEEVILVGAHYDHLGAGADGRIFFGAADNASGTAVVLEAATAFARSGVKPKRTLVFALWCAEEQGLYGSTHYVTKEPLFPLARTRMMIQLDYLDDQYGPCISNPDDNPVFVSFVGKAFEEKKLIPLKLGGQCASDDCPFLAAKVPAYRFIAYGDHHHRSTDTAENLSLTMLKNTADLVVAGLRNAAY